MKIRAVMDEKPLAREGVTIRVDKLEIVLDTTSLAEALAELGAKAVVNAIKNSGTKASASTIRQRKEHGISSDRLFYATGRLAAGVDAVKVGDAQYDIVAPPGYLADERVYESFQQHIIGTVFDRALDIAVSDEISDVVNDMVQLEKR